MQHFLEEVASLAFVCLFSYLSVSGQLLQGRRSLLHLFVPLLERLYFDAREDGCLCTRFFASYSMMLIESV